MKLSEYDDEDLIEEIKHRGFKILPIWKAPYYNEVCAVEIGGVRFEFTE